MVLRIVLVIIFRFCPKNNYFGDSAGADCTLPLLSAQKGIRITTILACGWVGSKGSSYQLNFRRQILWPFFSRELR